jgi:hypothetical protein
MEQMHRTLVQIDEVYGRRFGVNVQDRWSRVKYRYCRGSCSISQPDYPWEGSEEMVWHSHRLVQSYNSQIASLLAARVVGG